MSKTFNIDYSEVVAEFELTSQEAMTLGQRLLDVATREIQRAWIQAASQGLGSTRKRYINGIQLVKEGRLRNSIVLKGKLNNDLEYGIPPYDMKVGFANSGKKKTKIDGGWYLTIPFRIASSDAGGFSEAFSGVMPKEVEKVAKQHARTGGGVVSASDLPSALRKAMSNKTSGYQHKSSIYEGIRRSASFEEESKGNKYVSFRRVSDVSDPKSWIHPGIKAKEFAIKALKNPSVETVIENEIDKFLSE